MMDVRVPKVLKSGRLIVKNHEGEHVLRNAGHLMWHPECLFKL